VQIVSAHFRSIYTGLEFGSVHHDFDRGLSPSVSANTLVGLYRACGQALFRQI